MLWAHRKQEDVEPTTATEIDSASTTTSVMDVSRIFDFARMTKSFEFIEADYVSNPRPLPETNRFVTAMREVLNLFDTLGAAFSFVRTDIDDKITIIEKFAISDTEQFSHLHDAVCHEMNTGKARVKTGDPPSCSRTLLRLMWALKFSDSLLEGLKKAFDPQSDLLENERTLKLAVSRAYEQALAKHHAWAIRKAVKTACLLLPSKETFILRLGLESDNRDASLGRLAASMSLLVKRMYSFYEANNILDLP